MEVRVEGPAEPEVVYVDVAGHVVVVVYSTEVTVRLPVGKGADAAGPLLEAVAGEIGAEEVLVRVQGQSVMVSVVASVTV